MGRGRDTSAGGGKSSLDYLFGGGEVETPQPPPPTAKNHAVEEPTTEAPSKNTSDVDKNEKTPPATTYATNNYYRTDGQNCGNFITYRPSTKVHAAPGGSSSLDYLFGDVKK